MRSRMITFLIAALLLSVSCQRRQFVEWTTGVNVKLEVNTEIVNNSNVALPETMRLDLYNPDDAELCYTDYMSPSGGYIYPKPEIYDMLIYNIGTESTLFRNEGKYHEVEAYTCEVSSFLKSQLSKFLAKRAQAKAERLRAKAEAESTKGGDVEASASAQPEEKIVYEPDHIFVGHVKGIEIPTTDEGDDKIITIEVNAESVVETWEITLNNIEGLQWVTKAVAIISGQTGSHFIGKGEDSGEVVSIYFEMQKDETSGCIRGHFNTFGKHPNEQSLLSLDVNLTDSGGNEQHYHFDVDSDFMDNPTNSIVVEDHVVIEQPKGGGGFVPSVDEWEEIRTEIKI